MTFTRALCSVAAATLVFSGAMTASKPVKAEDLVDFLWGGSAEYGGGRSVTSFSSQYKPGQIIVSFSDRRLYLITKTGEAITYPVAVPMGEARWQGVTFVSSKKVNPSWTPTPEMVRNNPKLPRWVPGGHPMNPLGVRAMYLGSSAYRIHGTDAPWTIGQPVSHGCIRMTNEDVLDLYPRVSVGMRVTVTWQRFSTSPVASSDNTSGVIGVTDNGSGVSNMSARHSNEGGLGSLSSLFTYDNQDRPAAVRAVRAEPTEAPVESEDAPKKKSASTGTATSTSKKKPVAEAESAEKPKKASATPSNATPGSASHAPAGDGSVPDPKASEKSTDATPSAVPLTKASALATDTVHVEKVTAQVQ